MQFRITHVPSHTELRSVSPPPGGRIDLSLDYRRDMLPCIMKGVRGRIIIGFLFTAALQASDLQGLYNSHAWFRLRDAIATEPSDLFFQGAAAAAFHHRDVAH